MVFVFLRMQQLTVSLTTSCKGRGSSRRAKWELCSRRKRGTPFLNCLFRVQYAISLWINWLFFGTFTKDAISWILHNEITHSWNTVYEMYVLLKCKSIHSHSPYVFLSVYKISTDNKHGSVFWIDHFQWMIVESIRN